MGYWALLFINGLGCLIYDDSDLHIQGFSCFTSFAMQGWAMLVESHTK